MKTQIRESTLICLVGTALACALVFNGYAHFSGPDFVVYVGDAKQPAILPLPAPSTPLVAGERAALWWTVFCKAHESSSSSDARYVADAAVKTVYGDVK